jgi:hypothetical protein
MTQMRERVPQYEGRMPVWFWHAPKPDLRRRFHVPKGVHAVRIELELPRDRALLLDFDTWHCVLNRWRLSLSSRESREWDHKTRGLDQFRAPLSPLLEQELQASWQRVFDFDLLKRMKMWGSADHIQGVTEYLELQEVRSVKEFVGR